MTRVLDSSKWKRWRNERSAALALAGVCLVGCGGGVDGSATREETRIRLPTHSYTAPAAWGASSLSDVVLTGDVDGDGDEDIVRFGSTGTFVELAANGQFGEAKRWLANFGYQQGWRPSKHPRMLADVNGDGKKDIVAFGTDGLWTALSTGTGFAPPVFHIADFGEKQGFTIADHVRTTADVNGDGRADVVVFGYYGVSVARSNGTGFDAPTLTSDFGYQQGWRSDRHVRMMADVDGDHRADIVGFGDNDVWVARSTGTGFTGTQSWLSGFATIGGGWTVAKHPRTLADVDGDGRADIVGFGDAGVWVVKSTGTSFQSPSFWLAELGANNAWTTTAHDRYVTDVNGDGKADVVGFGDGGVYVALAGAGAFTLEPGIANFGTQQGWDKRFHERMLADVNGDHLKDIVGYGTTETLVSLSVVSGRILTPDPVFTTKSARKVATRGVTEKGAPMATTDEILGLAFVYPEQYHRAMRYVYGSQYNQAAGELLRVQLLAGDLTVDGLLWNRGGRTEVQTELSTLGRLFESFVAPGIVLRPNNEGAMFAMEILNVADERQAYVEGESGYLRDLPDNVMIASFGPWDWIKDKAAKVYHWAKDGVNSAVDWTWDKIEELGGKIEDFVEYLINSPCALAQLGAVFTCGGCWAAAVAVEGGTAGAATPLVIQMCGGTCATGFLTAIQTCNKEQQPNSLVSGAQMSSQLSQ